MGLRTNLTSIKQIFFGNTEINLLYSGLTLIYKSITQFVKDYTSRVIIDGGSIEGIENTRIQVQILNDKELLDEATLVLTPSGVKEGTLFSLLNSNGDFTFTRNSVSSRVNISNKIETVATGIPRIDYSTGYQAIQLEREGSNYYSSSEPTSDEGPSQNITYEPFNWTNGFTNCVRFGDNSVERFRYGGSIFVEEYVTYELSAFVIMDDLSEPFIGSSGSSFDFDVIIAGESAQLTFEPKKNLGNGIWRIRFRSVMLEEIEGFTSQENGIIKRTSHSSKGFRVVGWSVGFNSISNSYIPTSTGPVERERELLSIQNMINNNITSPAIVTYAFDIGLTDLNNGGSISFRNSSDVSLYSLHIANNLSVLSFSVNQQFITTSMRIGRTRTKIVIRQNGNTINFFIAGRKQSESFSILDLSQVDKIGFDGNDLFLYSIQVYDKSLTDAQCELLSEISLSERVIIGNGTTENISCITEAINNLKNIN